MSPPSPSLPHQPPLELWAAAASSCPGPPSTFPLPLIGWKSLLWGPVFPSASLWAYSHDTLRDNMGCNLFREKEKLTMWGWAVICDQKPLLRPRWSPPHLPPPAPRTQASAACAQITRPMPTPPPAPDHCHFWVALFLMITGDACCQGNLVWSFWVCLNPDKPQPFYFLPQISFNIFLRNTCFCCIPLCNTSQVLREDSKYLLYGCIVTKMITKPLWYAHFI